MKKEHIIKHLNSIFRQVSTCDITTTRQDQALAEAIKLLATPEAERPAAGSPAPGPYTFDGFGINAGDEHKSRIATMTPARYYPTPGGGMSRDETEETRTATAKLLAAAPEMLEALENLFKECSMIHRHWGGESNAVAANKAIEAGRQAIRKAKGGGGFKPWQTGNGSRYALRRRSRISGNS